MSLLRGPEAEVMQRYESAFPFSLGLLLYLYTKPNYIYTLRLTLAEGFRGVDKAWVFNFDADFVERLVCRLAKGLELWVNGSTSVVKLSAFNFLSSLWYLELFAL